MIDNNGRQVTMRPPARPTVPPKTIQIKGESYPAQNIKGTAYPPVHVRVESAHKNGGYSVVSCEFKEVFEQRVCEVWIEMPNGQRFPGTAAFDPSFGHPIEKAQTRAIGRALAFAGYQIETGIASADDMEGILDAQHATVIESEPSQIAAPVIPQIALDCSALAKELGKTEEEFRAIARMFTTDGKTNWDTVLRALEEPAKSKYWDNQA